MAGPRSHRDVPSRRRIVGAAKRGGITLVVGAGVSLSRGVPNWEALAQRLWTAAFGRRRSPWQTSDEAHSPRHVPQFLPIIFELAYRKLGEKKFVAALQQHLYARVRYPADDRKFKQSDETLAVLARLLVQEYQRIGRRRVDAVITFNVDDLIEQAVATVSGVEAPSFQNQVVRVVARPTHAHLGGPLRRPIPVYHVHGFVPSNHVIRYGDHFDHLLVFTDTQYWATSANASTFANRILSSALSEGRCIFIGLSMTDINILRWLALRALERDRDRREAGEGKIGDRQAIFLEATFRRHFWVRPASNDPTGFVSEFLGLRGVDGVDIESWAGGDFRALIEACFPPDKKTQGPGVLPTVVRAR
jgi:hypothetical protein